jgi:hypothetical protein
MSRRAKSARQRETFGFPTSWLPTPAPDATGRFTRRSDYRDDGFRSVALPPCPGRGGTCGKTSAAGIEHLTCPRCGAVRTEGVAT